MGSANPIKTNFTSGEISPLMEGRIDVTKYHNGVSQLENFVPLVQGGITRRVGTLHVAGSRDLNKNVKLIRFVAAESQSYVLEFGPQYLRIHSNCRPHLSLMRIPVQDMSGGAGVKIRITSLSHGMQTGDIVRIMGTTGVAGLNNDTNGGTGNPESWTITKINDNVFELDASAGLPTGVPWNDDGEFYTNQLSRIIVGVAFSGAGTPLQITTSVAHGLTAERYVEIRKCSGIVPALPDGFHRIRVVDSDTLELPDFLATSIVGWSSLTPGCVACGPSEIETPYLEAEVSELGFAQSADKLYLCHNNHPTRELRRYADGSWILTPFVNYDGPYMPKNYGRMVLTQDTNQVSIRSTVAEFASPADDGDYIEWKHNNIWRHGTIAAVVSTTEVLVDVKDNTLVGFDPEVQFSFKRKSNTLGVGSAGAEDNFNAKMGASRKTKSNPNSTEAPGIDPFHGMRASAAGTANITATHSGVFKRSHIGKSLRIDMQGAGFILPVNFLWYKITHYNNDSQVQADQIVTFKSPQTGVLSQIKDTHLIIVTLDTDAPTFVSTDTGRWVTLHFGESRIFGKISLYIDSRRVKLSLDVNTQVPRDPTDATKLYNGGIPDSFQLGAWSVATGYPGAVVFHEQRIVFARSKVETQTLWFSQTDDFTNFGPSDLDSTVLDTNAMTYTIASGQIDTISWLSSSQVLLIGTDSGEWQARAATSIQEPITPANISITPQTSYGSQRFVQGIPIGAATLFVQRGGRKVREMAYNFEIDKHISRDISIISEHIPRRNNSYIREVTYQQEPHQTYWVLLADGQVAMMTYEKEQEIIAWSRVKFGGSFSGGDAQVLSVASIPDGIQDRPYFAVKRTINGTTVIAIECLDFDYFPEGTIVAADQYFLDNGRKYVFGAPTTAISNLDHLQGQSVYALVDGLLQGPFTVSGGAITLSAGGLKVQVGLAYSSKMQVLPLETGGEIGVAQGKIKRFNRIVARLWKALIFKHGQDESNLVEESLGTTTFFIGDHPFPLIQAHDRRAQFMIVVDKPMALTLLALMPEGVTHERK